QTPRPAQIDRSIRVDYRCDRARRSVAPRRCRDASGGERLRPAKGGPTMSAISPYQDGLDISRPDEMTAAEIEAYRSEYTGSNKGLLDSFEFWLEFRPDVLKRHKARTRHYSSTVERSHPLVGLLGAIHQYTISAFREGIAYEIRLAQTNGATRSDILDTLS